jgi:hypothetical protein
MAKRDRANRRGKLGGNCMLGVRSRCDVGQWQGELRQLSLNSYAVLRSCHLITRMGEEVIRRTLAELIAGPQFMTDEKAQGGDAERHRCPAYDSESNALFTKLQKICHLSLQIGSTGSQLELYAAMIYRFAVANSMCTRRNSGFQCCFSGQAPAETFPKSMG